MKKDVPLEFLKEYEARRKNLNSALKEATSLLTLRLSQLNAGTGARATITESRVKRPARIWAKASQRMRRGVSVVEAFGRVEDILGIRIVCEAEVQTIGEARPLLDDIDLRERLDKMAERIRSFPLNADEWVVYSTLVASEISRQSGLRAVRKQLQDDWDEITAIARSELLPFSIDNFVEELQTVGSRITQYLSVLDCLKGCARCGTKIPEDTGSIVDAILNHYSTVVICHATAHMLPLEQPENADQDQGVRDGVTDCGACACGRRARGGLPRPV